MAEEYGALKQALVFGALKHAALYFDRLLPINPLELIDHDDTPAVDGSSRDMVVYWHTRLARAITTHRELLAQLAGVPTEPSAVDAFASALCDASYALQEPLRVGAPQAYLNPGYVMHALHEVQQVAAVEVYLAHGLVPTSPAARILELQKRLGGAQWTLFPPAKWQRRGDSTGDGTTFAMALTGLRLVDAAELEWDEILDIRRDPVAAAKLRNLRLYLHRDFAGKSPEYVTDALHHAIEAYDAECTRRGFKQRNGVISELVASKEAGWSAAALVALQLVHGAGASWGDLCAAAPLALKLLGIAIEAGPARQELAAWKSHHEVAFLVDLRDRTA